MDPRPLPIDMASLASFNKDLASQALGQLYVDGHVALALEWASRLDPFKTMTLRAAPAFPGAAPPPFPLLSPRISSYGSMVDFALASHDTSTLDALALNPGFSKALFSDRLDSVARLAAKSLPARPDFAAYLFDRLEPPASTERPNRYSDSGVCELADAAAANGKHAWLGRLNALRLATDGVGLNGDQLARLHFFSPPNAAGVQALLDAQCVSPEKLLDLARVFMASESPHDHAFALGLLERDFDLKCLPLAKAPQASDAEGAPLPTQHALNRRFSGVALFPGPQPAAAPLAWLDFYLSRGIEPFGGVSDGSLEPRETPAKALLAPNWRSDATRYSASHAEAIHQKRLALDDAAAPLLRAMLSASTAGAEERLDLATFGSELRSAFSGARKIDLLCVCIGQGFYKCADAMVSHGVDWRFAAKQCSQWLRRVHPSEPADTVAVAKAYCDALALRHVSLKSSQRRDARLEKKGEAAPAPARSNRL